MDGRQIIQVRSLKKDYFLGEVVVHALRGIDLDIEEGEFVSVMGASGSGKSTLLNIIGCLDKPTSGDYNIDGVSITGMSRNELAFLRNHKMGFVFQSYNLLPRTSALENVALPLLYNPSVRSKERRLLALRALDTVGLTDRQHHTPGQLSGGQQQRVAIARALVNNPVVILADEATGNLDTRTSFEIMALLQDLNNQGKTIVFVTHEPDIAKCTKRNIIFRDGHIVRENMVDEPTDADEVLKSIPLNSEYD